MDQGRVCNNVDALPKCCPEKRAEMVFKSMRSPTQVAEVIVLGGSLDST